MCERMADGGSGLAHLGAGDASELFKGLFAEPPSRHRAGGGWCRVAIGVCTAFRPKMLADCLNAIAAQSVPAGLEIHVVVADNEPAPSSELLVREFVGRCPFSVHYVHEPRRGIPQARNAVLERCRTLDVDWVAFTDDDCRVSEQWLVSLLESATRHQASVIYGRREFVFSGEKSGFWSAPGEQNGYAEGQALPYAATHNVLFEASLIHAGSEVGLAFDERLAHGEDTDFFHRAACRGARIVYSHVPVVFETVSPQRATFSYQARRAYHYAASRSYFHRRYRGLASAAKRLAARWVFQAPTALVRLIIAPLVWPFSGSAARVLLIKGTARLAGALGAAAGLIGRDGNPYRTIDGC
jgi:succinoglycan biosynthesis protein ExoM